MSTYDFIQPDSTLPAFTVETTRTTTGICTETEVSAENQDDALAEVQEIICEPLSDECPDFHLDDEIEFMKDEYEYRAAEVKANSGS